MWLVLGVTAAACGPSIDTAAKTDIDRRVSGMRSSGQSFTAPAGFRPRPLMVGQWAEYKSVDEDGKPSFMIQKIVGQDGNAFWFEVESHTYYGKSASAFLLDPGDRMNPDTMDIKAVKQRDNEGRETVFPPEMVSMMRGMFKSSVSMLAITWQNMPQENASVPAGSFAGCFKVRSDAAWGPFKTASYSWAHEAVPISGTVRVQGIDNPHEMLLVGFGDSGAKTVFASLP
jgi:hypothetical protein